MSAGTTFPVTIRMRADGKGLEGTLKVTEREARRLQRGLDDTGRSAQRSGRAMQGAGRQVDRLGARAQSAGMRIGSMVRTLFLLAGIGSVVAGIGTATRALADFEQNMAGVRAVTQPTEQEFKQLTATARELGATTEFSAGQAAAGMRFLGQAGFTAAQQIAAIPATLDLATAAQIDLAQSADITSNVLSGFRMRADQAGKMADVLAATSARANTNVAQLGDAMSFVGPVASALGIGVEGAAAAIGVLSDAGIQGSAAGTGLRRVLSSLANPTREAEDTLRSMGLTLDQVNPATNDLTDIIDTLAGKGLSAANALQIFGDRGGPAILALVSQNERLRDLTTEIESSEGAAKDMAETMRDTLRGDVQELGSTVQELILVLGDAGLLDVMRTVVQFMTGELRGALGGAQEHMLEIQFTIVAAVVAIRIAFGELRAAAELTGKLAVKWFTGITNAAVDMVSKVLRTFARLVEGVTKAQDFLDFIPGMSGLAETTAGVSAQLETAAEGAENLRVETDSLIQIFSDYRESADGAREAALAWGDEMADNAIKAEFSRRANEDLAASADDVAGGARDMGDELNGAGRASEELTKKGLALTRQLDELEAQLDGGLAPAQLAYNRTVEEYVELLAEGEITAGLFARGVSLAARQLSQADRQQKDAVDSLREFERGLELTAEKAGLGRRELHELNRELAGTEAVQRGINLAQQAGIEITADLINHWRELGMAAFDASNQMAGSANLANDLARTFSHAISAQHGRSLGDSIGNALRAQGAQGIQRGLEDAFNTALENMSLDLDDPQVQAGLNVGMASLGAAIGGNMGEAIGTALGGAIGSIFGPVGTMIGGMLGGMVGSLFDRKRDPRFDFAGSRALGEGFMATDPDQLDTRMGEFHINLRRFDDEAQAEIKRSIHQFHHALALAVGDSHLAAAQEALELTSFESRFHGDLEDLFEQQLEDVVNTIYDAAVSAVILAGHDIEDRVQRLADVGGIAREEGLGRALGMLGPDSFEATVQIVDELSRVNETLGETFMRLREIAASMDTALALTGNRIGETREELLRFGDALEAAFGEGLGDAMSTIFGRFFSDDERLGVIADQASQRARDLLSQLGLDVTDEMLTQTGFREIFDELFGSLSPEDTAILIEAGVAIDSLISAEESLARTRERSRQELTTLAQAIGDEIREMGWSPLRQEMHAASQQHTTTLDTLRRLNASEALFQMERERHTMRIEMLTGMLRASIADLAEDFNSANRAVQSSSTSMTRAVDSSAMRMRDSIIRGLQGVQDWLDRQLLGPSSSLLPAERLEVSGQQFFDAISAVQGGDMSQLGDLPGMADAFLRQAATFHGTSTSAFREIELMVREAMQSIAGIEPPPEMQAPTFGQTADIVSATQGTERSALDQAATARRIFDEIGLLIGMSELTAAEIARENDLSIGELIRAVTGELPDLTGDALAEYFNELVAETDQQLTALGRLEAIQQDQLDVLRDIAGQNSIGDQAIFDGNNPNDPPAYATGGWASGIVRTGDGAGPELILPHEVSRFFQRVGVPVNAGNDPHTRRLLERMEQRLANLEEIAGRGNDQRDQHIRTTQAGFGAVVSAEREGLNRLARTIDQKGSSRGSSTP